CPRHSPNDVGFVSATNSSCGRSVSGFRSSGALIERRLTSAAIDSPTSTRPRNGSTHGNVECRGRGPGRGGGRARSSTLVAALVDMNVLVYPSIRAFPEKHARATELLRTRITEDSIRVPHQALVEFNAATTKPLTRQGASLLSPDDARRELEEMLV